MLKTVMRPNVELSHSKKDKSKSSTVKKTVKHHKDNRHILELTLKCKLISDKQYQEIFSMLLKQEHENPDFHLVTFFRDRNIIQKENIELILKIKNYLDLRSMDLTFGKLAVKNKFATQEGVDRSLKKQEEYFRQKRQSKKIGDIMVDANEMTDADRTAVIMAQNRIKDEELTEAMNRLGNTELEKISINKRFGNIAVKKNYITEADVEEALKIQKEEIDTGKGRRFIGEILKGEFGLTEEKITEILKDQKEYEKSRLNLETTLNTFNAEIEIINKVSNVMEETVSENKLEAFITLKQDLNMFISVEHIRTWLRKQGIVFGIVKDSILQGFIENCSKGDRLKVAEGMPSEQGKEGKIEFYFDTDNNNLLNGYEEDENNSLVTRGTLLAKKYLPEKGKPGKDVFGHPILPAEVKDFYLGCGTGVYTDKEFNYYTSVDGEPMLYKGRTLFVKASNTNLPTHVISGDLVADTRQKDGIYNLVIEGTIHRGAIVNCHHLTVENNILGSVKATGDIEIKSGIGGPSGGQVYSDQFAEIKTHGNITFKKHIENAYVKTNGHLRSATGYLKSCTVAARNEISVCNVYSDESQPTILKLGIVEDDTDLNGIESEIKERKDRLKEIKCDHNLKALEAKLNKQIQVQDGLREQQIGLNFIDDIKKSINLSDMDSLEQVITAMKKLPDDDIKNIIERLPNEGTRVFKYMAAIMKILVKMKVQADRKQYIDKLLKENQDNYRNVVEAVQMVEKEYSAKLEHVNEQMNRHGAEIDTLEMEINNLTIEKDSILLTQEKDIPVSDAVILVKNQITKGTVIECPHSTLTLDKTLFRVKIYEEQDSVTSEWTIQIKGYFE